MESILGGLPPPNPHHMVGVGDELWSPPTALWQGRDDETIGILRTIQRRTVPPLPLSRSVLCAIVLELQWDSPDTRRNMTDVDGEERVEDSTTGGCSGCVLRAAQLVKEQDTAEEPQVSA